MPCGGFYPRLSCCLRSDSPGLGRLDHKIFSVNNNTECGKLLEEIRCALCSPYSQNLFHSPEREALDRDLVLPLLCKDYCKEFFYTCRGHIPGAEWPEAGRSAPPQLLHTSGQGGKAERQLWARAKAVRQPGEGRPILARIFVHRASSFLYNKEHKHNCFCIQEVVSGLRQPVSALHSGDGSHRLFILEKEGYVKILTPEGDIFKEPYLDIHKLVQSGIKCDFVIPGDNAYGHSGSQELPPKGRLSSCGTNRSSSSSHPTNLANPEEQELFFPGGDERGLLSLAFHPNYKKNGKLYVSYTTNQERWAMGPHDHILRVVEYTVSRKNPHQVDLRTARVFLEVAELHRKHLGGQLLFGPHGLLYIILGDGMITLDDMEEMDGLSDFTGSVLRLDVDTDMCNVPYSIPRSNPHFNSTNQPPEVFAHGLHDPGRCAVDRHPTDININLTILCSDSNGKNRSSARILQIIKGKDYGEIYILSSSKSMTQTHNGKLYKIIDPKRPLVPEECRAVVQPAQMLTSECSRLCRNGYCTPTGACCCTPGWEGDFCRIAKCEPACRHGGVCVRPNKCLCKKGYLGPQCEQVDRNIRRVTRAGILDQIIDMTSYLLDLTSYIV
ncbi:hypothetical protein QTO34_015948 [Cnephaeus nilssonii]|uniref:EGF-like domain-containing protein n=1 Tax=Cnephaeus nilssonii TaxID=3371016 RepID=A0AA40LTD7_CNENI|nr:hypothetical protein QTO34_015948 [Eptesicus nilssonii]